MSSDPSLTNFKTGYYAMFAVTSSVRVVTVSNNVNMTTSHLKSYGLSLGSGIH